MKKYIIGLGCSWTQGEGGYPNDVWKVFDGKRRNHVPIGHPDFHLRKYEHENSWVNVLARDYLTDHTSINLGHSAAGIRASTNQLHFCDRVDFENSTGYVILLLSSIDRFDVFNRYPYLANATVEPDDGYSNGEYRHYKWRLISPISGDGGPWEPLWTAYANILHSDQFVASEALMSLLNLQIFCQRYNYKLLVFNGFNPFNVETFIKDHTGSIANKFNWSCFHQEKSMAEILLEADGYKNPTKKGYNYYFEKYKKLDWPTKNLTTCIHPTIDGYKLIAKEMYKYL